MCRWRGAVAFSLLLCAGAIACGDRREGELREWRPEDHQPPPAVAPEGQGEAVEGPEERARAVAALWGMRCASCHGAQGRGDGAGRPPGAALPDMSDAAWQAQRSDPQLAEVIVRGRGMMPPFGEQLTQTGIDALIQHIRTLRAR